VFADTDPLVCLKMQLRPSLWAVVFGLLEQLGQPYSWRQDDPGSATPEQVIQEINKANATLPFARCDVIGDVKFIARAVSPWELLCDGDEYDRVDYPDLYAVLEAPYIIDADTFMVPDLIGRFPLGSVVPGDEDGSWETTLEVANLPAHHHTYDKITANFIDPGVSPSVIGIEDINTENTGDTGEGEPVDITNPYHTLIPVIVARLPQVGD